MTKIFKKIILGFGLLWLMQVVNANDNVYVYVLKYTKRSGEQVIVYCGITNNPEARVLEHARGGTLNYNTFDTMEVIAGPMPREEALKVETDCIYSNRIPRLYQTHTGDVVRPSELTEEEILDAVEEYESHYNVSRLQQIVTPVVKYTTAVKARIRCEHCGTTVTDGVLGYSRENFAGHIFCIDCQHTSSEDIQQTVRGQQHTEHIEAVAHVPPPPAVVSALICERCGVAVTKGVSGYSQGKFAGHVFCMSCQRIHRGGVSQVRGEQLQAEHVEAAPHIPPPPAVISGTVCEKCGTNVTDKVIDYSRKHFAEHVFCIGCQRTHRTGLRNPRGVERNISRTKKGIRAREYIYQGGYQSDSQEDDRTDEEEFDGEGSDGGDFDDGDFSQ